jgi:phosphoribosylamine-glycine ligase
MVMPTGKVITKGKFKRVTKRCIRRTLHSMSKEEKEYLGGLKFKPEYDTLKN